VTTRVRCDHPATGGGEVVDDTRGDPVRHVVGRETVEQEHRIALADVGVGEFQVIE
jgi:hypothetical protein